MTEPEEDSPELQEFLEQAPWDGLPAGTPSQDTLFALLLFLVIVAFVVLLGFSIWSFVAGHFPV